MATATWTPRPCRCGTGPSGSRAHLGDLVLILAVVHAHALAFAALAPAAPVDEVAVLKTEAASILPLVKSPVARAFVESSALLPHRAPRVLWRDVEHKIYLTDAEHQAMPDSEGTT